jgi:hypothetical protein
MEHTIDIPDCITYQQYMEHTIGIPDLSFGLIIFNLDNIIYITNDLMVMLAYMYYVIFTN